MDTRDQQQESNLPPTSVPNTGSALPLEIAEQEYIPDVATSAAGIPGPKKKKPLSPLQESLQRFRRDKRAMISLGVLLFLIVLAIIGPTIYKHIGGIYPSDLEGRIGPAV